jgi:hypothetical protein
VSDGARDLHVDEGPLDERAAERLELRLEGGERLLGDARLGGEGTCGLRRLRLGHGGLSVLRGETKIGIRTEIDESGRPEWDRGGRRWCGDRAAWADVGRSGLEVDAIRGLREAERLGSRWSLGLRQAARLGGRWRSSCGEAERLGGRWSSKVPGSRAATGSLELGLRGSRATAGSAEFGARRSCVARRWWEPGHQPDRSGEGHGWSGSMAT